MPGRARFFFAGGPGGGSCCCAPPEDDTAAVVGVASTSISLQNLDFFALSSAEKVRGLGRRKHHHHYSC
jgi:hypothetical protein